MAAGELQAVRELALSAGQLSGVDLVSQAQALGGVPGEHLDADGVQGDVGPSKDRPGDIALTDLLGERCGALGQAPAGILPAAAPCVGDDRDQFQSAL
ncbi:hypothetical protein QF035_009109 [Streptomyces umbrinus]|uniref:Uncharacterized protein n=1 Tax=Streptomyces umbrinus TaxID=67370 RepID=A0ABU0T799_9ACTN|nr:hypothetical protein [Streptomyces umbrinus]MDQ1031527.1 hypothetical protein [Streptomyces umbrinus]